MLLIQSMKNRILDHNNRSVQITFGHLHNCMWFSHNQQQASVALSDQHNYRLFCVVNFWTKTDTLRVVIFFQFSAAATPKQDWLGSLHFISQTEFHEQYVTGNPCDTQIHSRRKAAFLPLHRCALWRCSESVVHLSLNTGCIMFHIHCMLSESFNLGSEAASCCRHEGASGKFEVKRTTMTLTIAPSTSPFWSCKLSMTD